MKNLSPAPAEIVWNWSYTQTGSDAFNPGNGSGTFTSEIPPEDGDLTITAITGSFVNLGSITSLIAPSGFYDNTNLISPFGDLDNNGVSFVIGSKSYNLSQQGSHQSTLQSSLFGISVGTFSVTPVPPSRD